MKMRRTPMYRLLSLAMCICMVLALFPAIPLTAEAAATAGKIYFKPFDGWYSDGARFAAYFFGNGETWASMTDPDGDGIFECDVPSGYTKVIFCRMNGANGTNNWSNKWNQTGDLTIRTNGHLLYTMPKDVWDGSGDSNSYWTRPSCGYVGHEDAATCSFCGTQQVDIFFENNWNWSDIKLYYWYSDNRLVPSNPGMPMAYYGTTNGKNYYRMKLPADATGFVIGGTKEDKSGWDQTPDITSGWYDGITYYMNWEDGNQCGTFGFCEAFTDKHLPAQSVAGYAATCVRDGKTDGEQCPRCKVMVTEQQIIEAQGHVFDENDQCTNCDASLITIFFQNNWKWENVQLYYWYEGVEPNPGWPGTPMIDYGDITNIFGDTNQHYMMKIADDVDGIIISGYDPNPDKPEDGHNQQTPDISGDQLYNGITFYMDWDEENGNKVRTFDITEDEPCALGHSAVTVPGYAASCTASGMTDGSQCATCGETLTKQEEIPAPGHKDENGDGRCDACTEAMQPAYLIKTSASLEGNIAVNYFMVLSDEVLNDETAYMQFVIDGGEPIKIPVSEHRVINGYYVFTCEVSAKAMTESIVSQFFYEGGSTEEHPYDVKTYGKHILGNPNYDDDVTENLITTMLNYGAASQKHFNHNTENLANTEVTEAPDYSTVDISGFDVQRGQGTENVKLYTASLILNSETTLRLFFNGKITATMEGQALDVQYRGGLYYVDVTNIAAKDLDEDVTITINDGTKEATVTFNPMSYCQLVQKDNTGAFTEQMKDLVCALYLYNQAANAYFERG